MGSAREEFGPAMKPDMQKMLENTRIKGEVQGLGNTLQQAGMKQEGQSQLNLVKNDHGSKNEVKKDLTVAQGDRPALSPCDGNMQMKEAGQAQKNAGATGGQTQSAAKQLSPSPTPHVPQQAQGRSR